MAGSIATAGSIPPPVVSSRPEATIGLVAAEDSRKQGSSVGLAGEFQQGASARNSGTVLDSASSVAALDGGKQTAKVDLASLPDVAAAPVNGVIPSPVSEVRSPFALPSAAGAGQQPPASNPTVAPRVDSQESAGSLASNSAVLDAPTLIPSPTAAEFVGTAGDGDPHAVPAVPTQSGMPLSAMDPTSGTANAAAGVNQAASGSKPQSGNGDPGSVPAAPMQSGMPLSAMDPTSGAANAVAGVNQAASDSKAQLGNGDSRPVPATPTQTGELPAMDPRSSPTNAVTGIDQSAWDSKPQSGSGSGRQSLTALTSSSTVSRTVFSAEILKPASLRAAMAMRAVETLSAADAHAKEIPTAQGPSNAEGMKSKSAEPSPDSAGGNAQPLSPGAPPVSPAVQANGDAQPGSAPATANVSAPVSPSANQDAGSRNAAPAAEPQSPAPSPPASLPTVGPVEVARLVAGVAQSEMHIGLRTQAFGSVEVHTVVRDSQVGLTVGSERGDLRTLLANEVPGLQTTFRQQDLRFDNIRFLETSAGTTAGFSGGADSQPRSSSQEHSSPAGLFTIHNPQEDPAELDIGTGPRARLNVHA